LCFAGPCRKAFFYGVFKIDFSHTDSSNRKNGIEHQVVYTQGLVVDYGFDFNPHQYTILVVRFEKKRPLNRDESRAFFIFILN